MGGMARLLEGLLLGLRHREGVARLREAARLDGAHVLVQRGGHRRLEPRELVREAGHLLVVQPEQVVEDLHLPARARARTDADGGDGELV